MTLTVGILVLFNSFNKSELSLNPLPPNQSSFEQYPPYPLKFWLQKLTKPSNSGENLIFKVKYESDNILPPTNLLAGSGIVKSEATSFFGFDPVYWKTKSPYYAGSNFNNPSAQAKQIRQQFSLNTCIGCHAGETKTRFTMVNPMKYNTSANYWNINIDGSNGKQDSALYPWGNLSDPLQGGGSNKGKTLEQLISGTVINFHVDTEIHNQNFFQNVSPFLTGRRFTSYEPGEGIANWKDDEPADDNSLLLNDESSVGLFYVNDPSNYYQESSGNYEWLSFTKKWGFNDLLRRKNDLCSFLNSSCSVNPSAIQIIQNLTKIPLPLAGH